MRTKMLIAAAAALAAAAPAMAVETLTATFTTPDGGVTTGSYSGIVHLTVSGTGMSDGSTTNDAFYLFSPPSHDPSFYQLTFGTTTLVGLDPAQDAVNFIVGGLPAYSSSHVYSFNLNTGATAPTKLHFGVSDGVFGDNAGAYTITVGVPEPATWSLMIAGFALVGAAARRRSRVAA